MTPPAPAIDPGPGPAAPTLTRAGRPLHVSRSRRDRSGWARDLLPAPLALLVGLASLHPARAAPGAAAATTEPRPVPAPGAPEDGTSRPAAQPAGTGGGANQPAREGDSPDPEGPEGEAHASDAPATASANDPPPDEPPAATAAAHATLADLYARGEASFAAGELDAAVAAFEDGLERAAEDPNVPLRIRAYFSASLGIALVKRYERDLAAAEGDARSVSSKDLRRALTILSGVTSGHRDVLASEPTLEALARRNLERARLLMGRRQPPAPEVEDRRVRAKRRALARRQRRGGVGLLVTGTTLFVAGVAVLIDGLTLRRRALALAEDPPAPNQQVYIDEEVPRLSRLRYAVAGPALALGLGLVVGGAVLLGRASRVERSATARRRVRFVSPLRLHF